MFAFQALAKQAFILASIVDDFLMRELTEFTS